MANGSDILIAAEALEAEGHFGPASRLYEEARRLFEAARVGDAAFWTAVRRREECRELAKERGENPDVAMQVQLQLIRANPERFVREYYHGVAGSCIKRLRETAAEGRYQDLLSLAYRMTPVIGFVTGPLQHELAFHVCYFAGVAQNRLGAHGEAVANFKRAVGYSGHFADGVPRNARAGLCYGLGEAQFHTGANPEEALGEAITHYVALAADAESPPELVADANERRANAAVWLIAYYGWRPPRYPVQLQYALELADTALPLLQDAERLDELLTAVENLQRCFANIEPKQRCQMGDTAGRIIALAHEWMTRLGDARGVGRLGLVAVQTAESLGDYPLVIRLAQALAEDPAVRYDAESLAACGAAVRRAETCAAINEVLDKAELLAAEARYAEAHALAARAQGAADAVADIMLWERIDQLRAELDIRDPARLPRHARAIREWALSGEFGQADERLERLRAAQPTNSEIIEIEQQVTGIKHEFVDTCVHRANEALATKDVDTAEAAIGAAQQIGSQISYRPDGIDGAQAKVSIARAETLAERALECSRRSDHEAAMELLDQADRLPLLDEPTRAQLASTRAAIENARVTSMLQNTDAVAALVEDGQIEDADRILKTAQARGVSDQFKSIQEQLNRYRQAANRVARAKELIGERCFEDAAGILEGVISENITNGLNKAAAEVLREVHLAWAQADRETGTRLLRDARKLANERKYWEAESKLDEIAGLRYGRQLDAHVQELLRAIRPVQEFIARHYAPATDGSVMCAVGGAIVALIVSLFAVKLNALSALWVSGMSFGLIHGLSCFFRGGSWLAHDGTVHSGALAGACGGNLVLVILIGALHLPALKAWVAVAVMTGLCFWIMEARLDRACPARAPKGAVTVPQTVRDGREPEHHMAPQYIDDF